MTARFAAALGLVLCLVAVLAAPACAQSEEEITAARRRGIEFLKTRQKSDGSWDVAFDFQDKLKVGSTSLCTIALIENGVPVTDAVVQKGYEYVKAHLTRLENTYGLSMAVVLLTRMGDRRDRGSIKMLGARLMAGQLQSGGWTYTCPGEKFDAEKALRDPASMPRPKEGFGDNSCTQFAVLGLWVASRSGVNIDRTMAKVAGRFGKTQRDDGSWVYTEKDGPPNTMTGAGLFCLAVAQATQIREHQKSGKKAEGSEAPSGSLLNDVSFAKGFKRAGDFVKEIGPGASRYFLWSVERVGVLLGVEKFGETDWFQKGADALLKMQKEDGGWPSNWPKEDKDGVCDTSFALLFLRKANLGSDISRLLEGEQPQKFDIVGRKPAARFDTLKEALADAKPGETIRIDGPGPYKIGHLELAKDVTLQAGFGYAPVFKFEVGENRLGIKIKPETDPNGRDMITIAGGRVTLEGIKLQMDPPTVKQPVPWRAINVKAGSLRLLNCVVSQTNKQGMTGIVAEAPGRLVVRNTLFVGVTAGIEFVVNDAQELVFDNSIVFGNTGIVVSTDAKAKKDPQLSLAFSNAVFQVKEVLQTPKIAGKIDVTSRFSVFQAESIGASLLASPGDTSGRSWTGTLNLYDVKQWVGSGGKSIASLGDLKSWINLWGKNESQSFARLAPFVGLRQIGNYSHECNPQDWQLEFPADADATLVRARVGVNSYLAGPGMPFDQYRETIAYSDWLKGRLDLTVIERPFRLIAIPFG